MARFQDPSFCIKSIIDDGVPRFVLVRPSIVRIGSVEDFLFAFVLTWLACTLSFIEYSTFVYPVSAVRWHSPPLRPSPLLGSTSPMVRDANALNALTLCIIMTILSHTGIPIALRVIYADRIVLGPFHLGIRQVLAPNSNSRRALDSLHIDCIFLPEINPVNSKTLNCAPLAVGIVPTYALGF